MNVFVLCTGRSGSTTFIKAAHHITNFTSDHEGRSTKLGKERLNYPDQHIEADNRLSWFLGQLDQKYGDDAYYVHLKRKKAKTVSSENKRWYIRGSIIRPFCMGILMRPVPTTSEKTRLQITEDYYDAVTANIEHFLKDKSHVMEVQLESISEDFKEFWNWIGAEGNLQEALGEFEVKYNTNYWDKYQKFIRLDPLIHVWRRIKLATWR